MGDCTLIATPKGKTIMIDCGSSGLSDVILDPDFDNPTDEDALTFISDSISSPKFLNSQTKLDLLLVTHPDADHHNKLKAVLEPLGVQIGLVYYGGAKRVEAYKSSAYIKAAAGDTTSQTLRRVVVREKGLWLAKRSASPRRSMTLPLGQRGTAGAIGRGAHGRTARTGRPLLRERQRQLQEYGHRGERHRRLENDKRGLRFITNDCEVKTARELKLNGTAPNKGSLMLLIECFRREGSRLWRRHGGD